MRQQRQPVGGDDCHEEVAPDASAVWSFCLREQRKLASRFRLYTHSNSPNIWVVDRLRAGSPARFSLSPLRRDRAKDICTAHEICLLSHRLGSWQGPRGPRPEPTAPKPGQDLSWSQLAGAVEQRVIDTIPKRGSRVHLLNDLRLRISALDGPVTAERLEAWVSELDPELDQRSYARRLEVLSQIDRSQLLDLSGVLARLRSRRPRGAAVRLAQAQRQRVRIVPDDRHIEAWLDRLDPFNRWVFAVLAVYGLRPHELWHVEPPDEKGWVTIPGEMRTKSARAHFAPPVPRRWLERYRLAEQWEDRQRELRQRWKIQWEERSGVAIPVNNAELGQYLRKQFTRDYLPRLMAPRADDGTSDWLRPYDLRHCYAIRCATSAETEGVDPEQQAAWLGHSWDVHQRIYLRWLPPGRKRSALQRQMEQAQQAAALQADERQELEQLRRQMASLQALLGPQAARNQSQG